MVAPVLDTMTESGGGKVETSELIEVGKRLFQPSSSKDNLCSVLEQASMLFSAIQQLPHSSIRTAMESSMDALVQPGLLKHKDKDVRLLVTACISEIMRIVAPDAPYSDEILKEIFELIVASFKGLNEKESRYFDKRLKILESVATVRSCVVMLDLECDDLIREMFQTFFQTVSDEPKNIILAMRAIMCLVLEESEEIPPQLLEVLLRNLLHGRKGVSNAGYALARAVFERCAEQLKPHVELFLTSNISEGKLYKSKWKDSYHDLIFEIFKLDPRLVLPLRPKLIDDLQTDKLEVRLRAVRSVGRLLVSCKGTVPEDFGGLFMELVGRFSDNVVDVRLAVIEFAKHYLLANPSGAQAEELLAAFSDRLQDQDADVRVQVVVAICDYAKSNLESVPTDTLKKASECLWGTEASVMRETFQQLVELYRTFCLKISGGAALKLESFCWILSKLISRCSDGDPKDVRPQNLEIVISQQLFPVEFSIENRVKCWIVSFDTFDGKCAKAFERILSDKQSLHQEMQNYLATLSKLKVEESEEKEKSLQEACKRMANFFDEPAEADLHLQQLSQSNDTKLLEIIADLLDPMTSSFKSSCLREDLLKAHGGSDIGHDFLKALAIKCSFALFDKEHMQELLIQVNEYRNSGNEKMLKASIGLLAVVARQFSSLLKGAESDILELLKDDRDYVEEVVVQILAKIGSSLSKELLDKFNSVNLLEKLCMEGSPKKAKYAVQALSAMSVNLGSEALTTLYGKLLDLLRVGVNLPTTLQSLGCIAQHVSSSFQAHQDDLVKFLIQDLFKEDTGSSAGEDNEQHGISESAQLKIFGLKMLVKSLLPLSDSEHIEPAREIFELLLKLLKFGGISDKCISSDFDKAQLRLAAATAVLRLSKCYNSLVSPQLFHATVLCAKDPKMFVKAGFIQKLIKLINAQAVSTEYVCAFALSIDGGDGSLLEDAKMQLCNFVGSAQREKQSTHLSSMEESETSVSAYFPQYILFYLVHVLAQEAAFPSLSNGGPTLEDIEPIFRQLYLFIWSLLFCDGEGTRIDASKDDDLEKIGVICSMFSALKNAEDVVDASKTENTYILCDMGIAYIKDLLGDEFASVKVVDNIPFPLSIYKSIGDLSESSQQVERSYFPPILAEGDTFSKLKRNLPFGIDVVVKQGKRKADSSSLKDVKMPPQKRSKSTEILQGEKKESQKKNANEKVKPVDMEAMLQEPDHATPISPKRKRGAQYSHENGEVSSGIVDETSPKSSHKPKNLKVSIDEVEDVKHGGIAAPELVSPVSSATKRVRISIKKPKLPSEPVAAESLKHEDSSEVKKRGRKKAMDGSHDDSLHSEGTTEAPAQPLTSPRGTPRRSLKHAASSGLESPNSRVDVEEEASVQELIGCRIRVWWPMDKKFYQGVVESYQPSKKKHKVVYVDGDVEFLKLDNERWELVKGPKESPGSPSTKSHSEHGLQSKEKKVDSHSRNSSEGSDRKKSGKLGRSKKSASSTKHVEVEQDTPSNEADDTEMVDEEPGTVDGEDTPASAPKSRKSAEKNGSVGKRGNGKSSNPRADDHMPGESPSRDSRDSGDVPLKAWKSGRRKAH